MKLTQEHASQIVKIFNYILSKKDGQSIGFVMFKENYKDKIKFSIHSLHGEEGKKIEMKESIESDFNKVMKNYAKQI